MSKNFQIKYYNRTNQSIEIEKVYGEKAVSWLYQASLGKLVSRLMVMPWLSQLYGLIQSSGWSRKKVAPFIKNFLIPMDEYSHGSLGSEVAIENSYKSFNDFFIRKFKPNKRIFKQGSELPAIAEARYVGYESITEDLVFPVKGKYLNIEAILKDELSGDFLGGPLVIARLCPVDYHRYHYPADGRVIKSYQLHGELHSVNPLALKYKNDIFLKNERRVSILETQEFGKLAYVEVGAICVGKIVQTHKESEVFKRGDEKGYFLFGGSTVILIGQKGKWTPSLDILKNTKEGIETYIKLGDQIGIANSF